MGLLRSLCLEKVQASLLYLYPYQIRPLADDLSIEINAVMVFSSQTVVHKPAATESSGNVLEIQSLRSHLEPIES